MQEARQFWKATRSDAEILPCPQEPNELYELV
jgi:hypothetical protein